MRQIIVDTETTGLEPEQGHRIIEIGCVEVINRRPSGKTFHRYVRPDREVDPGALQVHGITNEFLSSQPRFDEIAAELLDFIRDAELVIHNAPFDIAFLNAELKRLSSPVRSIADICKVLDTLALARQLHPGQRNNLDALCKRYNVDNSNREFHGALLDARILLDVYLAMTGGQGALVLGDAVTSTVTAAEDIERAIRPKGELKVVVADTDELALHERALLSIDKASGGKTLWRNLRQVMSDS
jgi:DNA polymerase-3 subunit epsilon